MSIYRFVFIIISIWIPVITLAQPISKKYYVKKENIIFHNGDTVIQITAVSSFTKKKVRSDRKYFWYRQHAIYQTAGGYDGRLLHGTYEKFNPKSNLVEKGVFKYGLKKGKWIIWNPNGDIESVTYWKKGIAYTPKKTFLKRGFKKVKSLFTKSKKQKPPRPSKVLTPQDTTTSK